MKCNFSSRSENLCMLLRMVGKGTSLAVQWLWFHLPVQGVLVQSLVREPRSHKPHSQETKTQNRSNIVTSSIKTLKMVKKKREREWLEINRKNTIWNVLISIWNVHLHTNLQKANGVKWNLLLNTHWKLPFKGKVGHGDSCGDPARSELRSTPVCRWVQVPHLGFPFSAMFGQLGEQHCHASCISK